MSHRLNEIAGSLEAASEGVESDFMDMGLQLQSIHSEAAALTRQTLDAVEMMGGDSEESLLVKARGVATGGVDELKNCRAEVSTKLSQVNDMVVGLGELDGMCNLVEKIGMFLRVVGLNIDVESRRSVASREMFAIVAQEINRLSEKVMSLAKRIRDDAGAAKTSQLSAHGDMGASLNGLHELANDAEQAVQNALSEIETFMALSLEILGKAGDRSREISRAVSDIVVEIQFHDKMRQRIEHITHSLRQLFVQDADEGSDGETDPAESNIGFVSSVVRLQIVQLKEVIVEIEEGYQKSSKAFSGIGNEIETLRENLSLLRSGKAGVSPVRKENPEDPFAPLKRALTHLHGIVGQGHGLVDIMMKAAIQASVAAARLSQHTEGVRHFSFETRLMALNAIVKAARLGAEGRTLEVLAQEVKGLSDQSNAFASNVDGALRAIKATAHDLQTEGAQRENGDGAVSVHMSLDGAIQEISGGYARFDEDSSDALARAGTLEKAVFQSRDALAFLPALADGLTQHLLELEEIDRMLISRGADEIQLTQGEIDRLLGTYTMQQERDVYERHMGRMGDPDDSVTQGPDGKKEKEGDESAEEAMALLPIASGEAVHEEDDLGDNVELF